MLWPVYILALGAAFLGLLQIPGVTHVMSSWLEPISPHGMVEATAGQIDRTGQILCFDGNALRRR
jgi:hypothetical protein